MKKITVISFLLVLLVSSCSLIKQYRYMSKAKAPKGTFRTEIPFELNNGLIVIKVKLNGSDKEFAFILDSGAPVSIIYQEAFESSKAKTVMTYKVSDSQGNSTKSDYVMLNAGLGDLLFKDIFAAYSPNTNEFISCIAAGGVIGANLMQTANWQIDFANEKIVISDFKKASLPDLKEYQKVSFSKRAPFGFMPWLTVLPGMTVDLKVNGKLFKDVFVDLGSSGALTLPKNAATDRLFKNDLKEVRIGASFGLLGARMDTTFNYSSSAIYMEKIKFNDYTIDIAKKNQSLLGMKVFSDYMMFIDFRKKDLYLKPIVRENSTTDEKEFGFSPIYDSKSKTCYVISLYEGSSAVKAGLQLKDTLVEINNEKLPAFNDYCEFKKWYRKFHSQEVVMLKTRRSNEIMKIEKAVIPKR
ncbi:MAG: hypothetical protein H0W73_08580 [Bacteroidetes bacterium]|nr:hypothetical protein [Bacteroidota bacterium]